MIDQLAIAVLGGFFGKYRGGLFKNRDKIVARIGNKYLRNVAKFLVQGDTVFAFAFAMLCVLTNKAEFTGAYDTLGAPVIGFISGAFILWLVQFTMSYRGQTPGWGEYIGAAAGWRTDNPGPEVEYIDEIIEPLKSRPRLWGIAGLSLRCGEWAFLVAAPLAVLTGGAAFFLVAVGLLAGPVVYGLSRILPHAYVWPVFEVMLGAGLFLAAYNA